MTQVRRQSRLEEDDPIGFEDTLSCTFEDSSQEAQRSVVVVKIVSFNVASVTSAAAGTAHSRNSLSQVEIRC